MSPVFADTFYWIALSHPADRSHRRALSYDRSPDRPDLVTTEEVLSEYLTFFSDKGAHWRGRAAAVVRSIVEDESIRVIPQSSASFRAGLDLYASRLDKGYSHVDCVTMEAMRCESLTEVLTNDRHFQQEGFQPVFRDGKPRT